MQYTCCIMNSRPLNNVCITLKVGRSSRVQSVYLSSYFQRLEDARVALSAWMDGLYVVEYRNAKICCCKTGTDRCCLATC